MLILYLAVLITGMYWAAKILLPELAKPPLPRVARTPRVLSKSNAIKFTQVDESGTRTERLEALLEEKNKNIQLLQMESKAFLVQIHEFDKIRTLLENEIKRLREQNTIFRSELGIPATQPKEENSIK